MHGIHGMHRAEKEVKFGHRAEKFDSGIEGRFLRKYYRLFMENATIPPNSKVLDVGCGTGELLLQMDKKYGIRGFGIDYDDRMIRVAKEKCPEMSISVSSCDDMPFDDQSFDVMTVCMAYHHFENRTGFMLEAARVMKKGGRIYIIEFSPPEAIRKIANLYKSRSLTVGNIDTFKEICSDFKCVGIQPDGYLKDGLAHLICLKKPGE